MPFHVMAVFGTRPEAIKMAPVLRRLRKQGDLKTSVVLTGQHREMLDQVLSLFHIRPDTDLRLMQPGQSLEHVVTEVLNRLGPVLESAQPNLVLVHGDTVTTFAAALSAFYHRIPVGHVEAGLRSQDMANPFPEEANRVLADHLCSLHFAPTAGARRNLRREGIAAERIFVTGNTVTDALLLALEQRRPWANPHVKALMERTGDAGAKKTRFILLTAHRRENHGAPLEQVLRALRRVVDDNADVRLIYPVHLNPAVQKSATEILSGHPRIHLLPPLDYLDLVRLMEASTLIVTDSGGIQEEAPTLGKPVLVLRKVTERPEAVAAGTAAVIGVQEDRVYKEVTRVLSQPRVYARMANAVNPYGDGRAAGRIVDIIRYRFGLGGRRPADFAPRRRRAGR